MKHILFIAIFASFMYANALESMSFNDAIKQAKDDEKITIVMYGQDNCQASQKANEETFENADLVYFIEENFHYVYINISNSRQLRGLPSKGTPTFYFLDKNKKLLKKAIGFLDAKAFRKLLDGVLLKLNKSTDS